MLLHIIRAAVTRHTSRHGGQANGVAPAECASPPGAAAWARATPLQLLPLPASAGALPSWLETPALLVPGWHAFHQVMDGTTRGG